MTTTKNSKTTAPLAHRVPVEVSALIDTYAAWIEEQTGYKADPMSVYLGSQLRGTFQKGEANQSRLQQAAKDRAARDAAKVEAKAAREAAAAAKAAASKTEKPAVKAAPKPAPKKVSPKRPTKAGSTIATTEGVVIAEQNHIDAVQA
jgi:sRNA-binding protein